MPERVKHHEVSMTLVLIMLLAGVFLKGFREAIGIAVVLVAVYLLLNLVIVGYGLYQIILHPHFDDWRTSLFTTYGNPLTMAAVALLLFPKLALGLSGFETGVVVMPLVRGDPGDTEANPHGRIRNTHKLLTAAALIMSVLLITSSLVTTLLIPHEAFLPGGEANGRALAWLAHHYLGDWFGTLYDLSTITILWFAGASALAGLLNIVPRYLPRYGMAPNWARALRPLVLVYTAICFVVTMVFRADVNLQAGAYATGVLFFMASAAAAVTLSCWRQQAYRSFVLFGLITLVFVYTIGVNIYERPEGIQIAGFFIGTIILMSLVSRVWRVTELRVERFDLDATAQRFLDEAKQRGAIRIIANRQNRGDAHEYRVKEREVREDTHIPAADPVLFLEIRVRDPSDFADVMKIQGVEIDKYRILRADSTAVPNSIAAFLLYVRNHTGKIPHAYFGWAEGNPLRYLFRFILFGEGDIAPVTREVLRQAEPNPERRPVIHVGG